MNRSGPKIIFYLLFAAILFVGGALGFWFFFFQESSIRPFAKVTSLAGSAGELGEPFGSAIKGDQVFVSDGEKGTIWRIEPNGKAAVFADGLNTPSAITYLGNSLIVADTGSHTIRKIGPDGRSEIVAGADGSPGMIDGNAAESRFTAPIGIAAEEGGRIYVADTYNDRIRVIENGQVTTLSGSSRGFSDGPGGQAKFDTPTGIAVWDDRLLVADTGNRRIRVVEKDGTTWTLSGSAQKPFADGLLSEAGFASPAAITVSSDGRIFVADGNAIRCIHGAIVPLVTTISGHKRGLQDGRPERARFNRPSGLAVTDSGDLIITDSENRVVRRLSPDTSGREITPEQIDALNDDPATFRAAGPPRWPYDPPDSKHDIAGTLGELRGDIRPGDDNIHFHNGLDIAGGYGETARFVRDEKVLRPIAAENFGTLRELIRLPTMGYIHIRLGRYVNGRPFGDPRFIFTSDAVGNLTDVRVPRGTQFRAGEAVGTLNPMNHVHLIAGRSGSEMNALDVLALPGVSDTRPPIIENVMITDESWAPLETKSPDGRIVLNGRSRIVIRTYDQMDGNADRRRLGVYAAGYQLLNNDLTPIGGPFEWNIKFDRLPDPAAVRLVYADGSHSGATGETIFKYIATNRVEGEIFREEFLDPSTLSPGPYIVRVSVADRFGNRSDSDIKIEVSR